MRNLKNYLKSWVFLFDVATKLVEIKELDEEISKDGFWDDLESSQKVLQKSKGLKASVDKYEALVREIEDLETLNILGMEEDDGSVIEEIYYTS